uniref:Fibrinogen C-terminal domain-containing protein n=1 Tax=Anopheles atroparvus TaxID=41427 RepID=A0A182IVE7_ANOAO
MYPKSCRAVTDRVSGVYSIQPEWPFKEPMLVYCDQDYESGGWTVIQRRIDGTVSFERDSSDYAQGFGNLNGEFWLGLENIYKLVKSAPHELVLVVEDFSGNTSYAKYSSWDLDRVGIFPRHPPPPVLVGFRKTTMSKHNIQHCAENLRPDGPMLILTVFASSHAESQGLGASSLATGTITLGMMK